MGTEEVLKKIRSRDGVLDAFVIDEDVLSMIEGEESNIRTSGGLVYENLGIDRSKEMDTHVCVFSKGFITDPKGPMAVQPDGHRGLRHFLQPYASARQPEIGQLGLPAVLQLLLEDTVFIADRIACSMVAASCVRPLPSLPMRNPEGCL